MGWRFPHGGVQAALDSQLQPGSPAKATTGNDGGGAWRSEGYVWLCLRLGEGSQGRAFSPLSQGMESLGMRL